MNSKKIKNALSSQPLKLLCKYIPKSIFYDEIGVDSLAIYLDAKNVHGTSNFEDIIVISSATGEILEEKKLRTLFVEDILKGIKVYASLVRFPNGDYFVRLGVSAKLLEDRYFEGITVDNIKYLYHNLIKLLDGKLYFTINTFLKSLVGDIDFNIDFTSTDKNYEDLLNNYNIHFPNNTKLWKQNKTPVGFEFSRRNTTTWKLPYIKIYNKSLEMLTRSENFSNYIGFKEVDLRRLEFTLKNSEFLKRYLNVEKLTFMQLLELRENSQSLIFNVLFKYFDCYFNGSSMSYKISQKKRYNLPYIQKDKTQLLLFALAQRLNLDIIDLENIYRQVTLDNSTNKKWWYRFKKKYIDLELASMENPKALIHNITIQK